MTGWLILIRRLVLTAGLAVSLHATAPISLGAVGERLALEAPPTVLPNGWSIRPAGRCVPLPGDLPLRICPLADGRRVLVLTGGYHDHGLSLVDPSAGAVVGSQGLLKVWAGLAMEAGGAIYVSGGGPPGLGLLARAEPSDPGPAVRATMSTPILRLKYAADRLEFKGGWAIPGLDESKRFIGGLAVGPEGALFVVNLENDTLYKLSPTGAPLGSVKVGGRPFAIAASPDGKAIALTLWGEKAVVFLAEDDLRELGRTVVGTHPVDLAFGPDGRLFVANAGSDTVSVIKDHRVTETIRTTLEAKSPFGATPDALAVSGDGRRLYVANADDNDVAVIDISREGRPLVLGFIPTGWYPSALALSPDGRQLYVGIGKGTSRANYPARLPGSGAPVTPFWATGADLGHPGPKYDFIGTVLTGFLEIVDVPGPEQLAAYSRQVRANFPPPGGVAADASDQREALEAFRHIKHVVYIIRENRSYDQVFGDLEGADGDPALTLFGQTVTPNAHALARQTVIFDNLYVNGEVSFDGHQWCDAAYVTNFTEKTWPMFYGGRSWPKNDPRLSLSPAGYLWDSCRRLGLSYLSYGEEEAYNSTGKNVLQGHISQAWARLHSGPGMVGKPRDPDRVKVFVDDLKRAEATGDWPAFMIMALGEDHTDGLTGGDYTPKSCVASNDQALGRLVEAVTHSRFWPETAIFVIEDDAQWGPDHVDCHRTVGLVLSPYVRRGLVDRSMYSTVSMVRTMELILGLAPMTQFDAAATPMLRAFTSRPEFWTYTDLPPQVDLEARNPKTGRLVELSATLDFSEPDRADFQTLNHILWESLKPGIPMPAPVHNAWIAFNGSPISFAAADDDDDTVKAKGR